jgi:hypothetical protein
MGDMGGGMFADRLASALRVAAIPVTGTSHPRGLEKMRARMVHASYDRASA